MIEKLLWGWLPVWAGILLIFWGTRLTFKYKKTFYKLSQFIILTLSIYATWGQFAMTTTPCWPTGLFILIIALCAVTQTILWFNYSKSS